MALPAEAAAALERLELFGIHLGLDRPRRLLAELGSPQRRVRTVLVAGTNGKGSVAANLSGIAQAAGYRTALYTSPHLETVEERLRIDGEPVSGERLGARILETLAAAERVLDSPPTYFEALTAAAFAEMAAPGDGGGGAGEPVDLAVVEVGLGGRLDATNTAEPVLSLITPISLEHREWLGETPAAIAREKAGILRRGRPVIAWGSGDEARDALTAAAHEVGAALSFGDRVAAIGESEPEGWRGQSFTLRTSERTYRLRTPLLGEHQLDNSALAVLAAETLAHLGWDEIDADAVARGVAGVSWPGRLEVLELPPGAGPARVLLDAGHNPDAAARIAAFVRRMTEAGTRRFDLLAGLLGDKEAESILPPLAEVARGVVLTRPPHGRGRDPGELAPLLAAEGRAAAAVEPDLDRALDRALGLGGETLLVCGSFYLVGAVRRMLRQRFGTPGG